jgi:hypothetical protein
VDILEDWLVEPPPISYVLANPNDAAFPMTWATLSNSPMCVSQKKGYAYCRLKWNVVHTLDLISVQAYIPGFRRHYIGVYQIEPGSSSGEGW